jgi:glycosyltransferase involved in cell wall biosynthesis
VFDDGRPLRVLVVTNMFPTEEEPWYGSFVRDQVEDLAALGVALRVLSFDGRRDPLNYLRAVRDVRQLVSREPFDLVHAHYGLTGAIASLQGRVPVVTTFHGSDYTGAVPWQRYISWVVSRRSLPIVASEEGRRALGRPSALVIPAGVDTALFCPIDRTEARRQLGWDEDAHYVLLPGARMARGKRADLFEAAVAEARAELPTLRGVYLERFSRQEAALAFNAVDVTLVTSDSEGSPVSVRESLACMTPVVSVDVGDVSKVLAGLPGCSVYPRDPRALARGVLAAVTVERHPDLRYRAERTSRRRVAERLTELYSALAKAGRA